MKIDITIIYDGVNDDTIRQVIFVFVMMNEPALSITKEENYMTMHIEVDSLITDELFQNLSYIRKAVPSCAIKIHNNEYKEYTNLADLMLLARLKDHEEIYDRLYPIIRTADIENILKRL